MPDYRNILLIKPSSLGDVVHAMPTLAALRHVYPFAKVTWFVKRQWARLVERFDGVDQVWAVDPGLRSWLSQVSALRARRFDLAVDLQGLLRSAFIGWGSGASCRVGFANAREGSPWWYTQRVLVPTVDMHAVDRYLLVAKSLGAVEPGPAQFNFRFPQTDQEQLDRLLLQADLAPGTRWVAMNVSARWTTKRWPARSYALLADHLVEQGSGPVVFLGGSDDRAGIAAVRGMMKTRSIDFAGVLPVELLPSFLSRTALLITNDSGPMHIAAAVGAPIVALFGPTSPMRTGPYGKGHRVLTHEVACRPCFSRTCRNAVSLECLTGISPDQVLAAALAQLAPNRDSR